MACKYLAKITKIIPGGSEVGGPIFPQKRLENECLLGRKPDILFWPKKCSNTPPEGPCWFWLEEYGRATPDLQFAERSQQKW